MRSMPSPGSSWPAWCLRRPPINSAFPWRIHGTTALIGANSDASLGNFTGAAYVFDIATNTQLRKIVPADAAAGDNFGVDVALDGTRAIIGSPLHKGSRIRPVPRMYSISPPVNNWPSCCRQLPVPARSSDTPWISTATTPLLGPGRRPARIAGRRSIFV